MRGDSTRQCTGTMGARESESIWLGLNWYGLETLVESSECLVTARRRHGGELGAAWRGLGMP